MAEDQGVNGTIWNKEANYILSWFGWETIGDIDMDVLGDDEQKYGVDTFLKFESPVKHLPPCVILEAKSYQTSNVSKSIVQDWIDRLDKKLSKLKYSEKAQEKYPALTECATLDLGIIAIWFHDLDNYKSFRPKFVEILKSIKTSNRPKQSEGYHRILLLDNAQILKLCSLQNAIAKHNQEARSLLQFYYPSFLMNDKPIVRSKVLTPEYIFSKVILAESKGQDGKGENVVFYFGDLQSSSFAYPLKNLLSKCGFMDKEKKIILYLYNTDNEFRKIKPDIEKVFNEVEFTIKFMDNLSDLPGEVKTIGNE